MSLDRFQGLFPKISRPMRLVCEREPCCYTPSSRERKLCARCALLSLINIPWMVAGRMIKVAMTITALVFMLIISPFSKKMRTFLQPCCMTALDATFSIPLLIAAQAILIFKHLAGIVNPKICFRLGSLKEQLILTTYEKGRNKLKNRFNTLAWKQFRKEEYPNIRKRYKILMVYEKQFYPVTKIEMLLRKSKDRQILKN